MKIGFLGHNGFALGDMENPILVDPILLPSYGNEYSPSAVEIYPPRQVDFAQFPRIAAVIISHEHSDHFHLPSLDLLDRQVPIIVGPTMVEAVVDYIQQLGFHVQRLNFGTTEQIGSVLVTLYPPDPETVLWESRVSQIYARDAEHPEEGGIYLCIDAILSRLFYEHLCDGIVSRPRVLALSNNSQVTPDGVFGSLDNMRTVDQFEGAAQQNGFVGLGILYELLVSTIINAPALRGTNFLICGGGFLKDYDEMGPFPFSEQHILAELASKLTRYIDVLGPLPGDVLSFQDDSVLKTGHLTWLNVDGSRFEQLMKKRNDFIESKQIIPMKTLRRLPSAEAEKQALKIIESELALIARAILLSPLGKEMIQLGQHQETGPSRFLIKVLCEHLEDHSWELNIAEAKFILAETNEISTDIKKYPFGFVIGAGDLAEVFTGGLQIWDVAGIAMRSWYQGDVLNSPLALFYDLYGEQTRPDIAFRVYTRQMKSIIGGIK